MGIPRLSHQQQWRAAHGLQQQPSQTTRVSSKSLTSVACGVSPIHLLAHCTYFNGLLVISFFGVFCRNCWKKKKEVSAFGS